MINNAHSHYVHTTGLFFLTAEQDGARSRRTRLFYLQRGCPIMHKKDKGDSGYVHVAKDCFTCNASMVVQEEYLLILAEC
jgi:hypothetical protein